MTEMKLSQPRAARTINTARVLNALRTHRNLSKAETARILGLNKVSTGEIIDTLTESGLVLETGKLASPNGRHPTTLALIPDARYVLSIDIGPRTTTLALCDLLSRPVHLQRIPTSTTSTKVESFCYEIIKAGLRIVRLVDQSKILGVGISIPAKVSEDGNTILSCPFLPWTNIPIAQAFQQILKIPTLALNSTSALVNAERVASSGTDLLTSDNPIIYIDWGSSINMALVCANRTFGTSNNFGHLKVSPTGLCSCGKIGCLEAVASAWALSGSPDAHLKDIWDQVTPAALNAMATAIDLTAQVTGATKTILSGQGATIPDARLQQLQALCPRDMQLSRSMLGDKANTLAAAEIALDNWFYHTSLLSQMQPWL